MSITLFGGNIATELIKYLWEWVVIERVIGPIGRRGWEVALVGSDVERRRGMCCWLGFRDMQAALTASTQPIFSIPDFSQSSRTWKLNSLLVVCA